MFDADVFERIKNDVDSIPSDPNGFVIVPPALGYEEQAQEL
jgi:hypothetical protein